MHRALHPALRVPGGLHPAVHRRLGAKAAGHAGGQRLLVVRPVVLDPAQRYRGAVQRQPAALAGLPEPGGGHRAVHVHAVGQHPHRADRVVHRPHGS